MSVVPVLCTLSSVCFVWRDVAHSNPRLWSELRLSIIEHRGVFMGDVSWVREWLSRSQSVPLDIELHVGTMRSINQQVAQEVTQVAECILEFRHHIGKLQVAGSMKLCLPLFHLPQPSFPLLEDLSLFPMPIERTAHVLTNISPHKILAHLICDVLCSTSLKMALFWTLYHSRQSN
ncbi:hypothetical protein GYMLUDRAFT_39279 [Collybiopsis luxurians FD-317 M1]|nr:hypothetical protein GYMLUDRAFT_39279 [Collybiopsis luxurians FD-317 M1]